MTKKHFEIKIIDSEFLSEHYEEFYALFSENTRGHENEKVISELYITEKAMEIFKFMANENTIIIGSVFENEIVGILWAYKRVFLEENRIYVNSLIVKEEYRGMGIGKNLMSEMEKIALKNNIYTLDLSTSTFKVEAINFYENLGYESERIQFKKHLR